MESRRLVDCSVRLLLLTLLVVHAFGQTPVPQTSPPRQVILVTVSDENGVAVPSALVFLQLSPQSAVLRCVTDFAGRCQFANLSAASYSLRVEKQGFYSIALPSVQVGATQNVDVTVFHQQEVREVVNVVESPPAIDPAQISNQRELTGVDIINIPYPTTRDYRNALNFIPGVVQDISGQPHIAGAETYQTLTLLDGFNVTQPANGRLDIRVSPDSLRSVDVETSRYSAEYGKGSAGILGLNTGIGDDHFRYAATNFIPSFQTKKGLSFDAIDPRFVFSGPIRKGQIWFFDSPDGEFDNIIVVAPQLPGGAATDHFWRYGNLAKVQANLTARDILTTSFNINHLNDEHAGLSSSNPPETTPQDVETGYMASVKNQHYFQNGDLLEVGGAFVQYGLGLTPLGSLPYQLSPETASGNYYLQENTRARRWQGIANLFLAPKHWHGQHEFKAGIDVDRLTYHAAFQRTPVSFLREGQTPAPGENCVTPALAGMPSPCSRYSVFSGGEGSATYNVETSGYFQDRWLATNRLLIEPGLRLDWDEIVRAPLFSPRLAGTYVLDNSGNSKLSAGIGIVYDATPLFLMARPHAGQRADFFFNSLGLPVNLNGMRIPTPAPVLTTFSADTAALEAPRYLNWSVGFEQKLPFSLYFRADFLQRNGRRGFVYNTANGLPGGNFVLQNTRDDRYHSFQVSLRRTFRHRYTIFGSYTHSSSRSNQVLDFNVDDPILSPQAPGPYPWDTPNRFLSWGMVPFFKLPIIHELDIPYSLEARSGFPFSVFNEQDLLAEPPGSRRFPTYFSLNLFVEKRFHAFNHYWAIRGGVQNITGHANPAFVNADISSPQFLTFSAFQGRAFTTRIRLLGKK